MTMTMGWDRECSENFCRAVKRESFPTSDSGRQCDSAKLAPRQGGTVL